MKNTIRLKLKNGTNSLTLCTLFSDSTLKELIKEIRNMYSCDKEDLELLNGYPPKLINISSMATTLSEVNISSGDCIIVKILPQTNIKKIKLDTDEQIPSTIKKLVPKTIESAVINQKLTQSILIKKTIPSDNSCLFASVYYCLHNGDLSQFDSSFDRQMIAGLLQSDPDKFNEAYLDNKSNLEYSKWIMNVNNWGGAIELYLLSKLHKVEIDVVNSQYNRVDRFGEDEAYTDRILILYDGIHYDALVREYLGDGKIETKFPIIDKEVLVQANQLSNEARLSKQYTDIYKFSVKCYDCNKVVTGQDAAAKHAKESGHSNFGEVHTG